MKPVSTTRLTLLALTATAAYILLSPKWTFVPAAWFAPGLLLMIMQQSTRIKATLTVFAVLLISGLLANFRVMPFPTIFFVIIYIKICALLLIPFLVHRLAFERLRHWTVTLVLPSTFVVFDYVNALGEGQGTWGMLAYSQVENLALVQLASVTGIWGISFLIYWWSSVLAWSADQHFAWHRVRRPILTFAGVLGIVLLWGTFRSNPYFQEPVQTVRVAGISGSNLIVMKQIYEDAIGKPMDVDLNSLTQTSPEVQEMQKGIIVFIEKPLDTLFAKSHKAMISFQDSLFAKAEREAKAGAKIISFSEALFLAVKSKEDVLLSRGKQFAKENGVFLLLTTAVILPGKIEAGRKFMENKSWLIGPKGDLLNTFFKNKPVPIAEAGSVPGDGVVPVVQTSVGNIATSICYDADFPSLMRQAGEKGADIMLLPSGDWKEISPYHARMAAVRAVENGFSLLRTVSGAYSVAADGFGHISGTRNYYDTGEKVLVSYLPAVRTETVYARVGDSFVILSGATLLVLLLIAFLLPRAKEMQYVSSGRAVPGQRPGRALQG